MNGKGIFVSKSSLVHFISSKKCNEVPPLGFYVRQRIGIGNAGMSISAVMAVVKRIKVHGFWKKKSEKKLTPLATLAIGKAALCVVGVWLLAGCEKARLDDEVRRLCAIDGGIKVYERTQLPKSEFNEYGQVSFYKATPGSELVSSFVLVKEEKPYKEGNPRMWRTYFAVRRIHDGKVLGESVGYTRFGDGFEGPFHPSSFQCPQNFGEVPLLEAVFFPSQTY